MNKRTRTTGHIKYALFAPLTAALPWSATLKPWH